MRIKSARTLSFSLTSIWLSFFAVLFCISARNEGPPPPPPPPPLLLLAVAVAAVAEEEEDTFARNVLLLLLLLPVEEEDNDGDADNAALLLPLLLPPLPPVLPPPPPAPLPPPLLPQLPLPAPPLSKTAWSSAPTPSCAIFACTCASGIPMRSSLRYLDKSTAGGASPVKPPVPPVLLRPSEGTVWVRAIDDGNDAEGGVCCCCCCC
mmetsp:Transcript_57487/g.108177  ORF Transcript_57487/g.108177 Transcript_57487/m.108177 type:complete len:207 (-) Transcript_57487:28-648(-)